MKLECSFLSLKKTSLGIIPAILGAWMAYYAALGNITLLYNLTYTITIAEIIILFLIIYELFSTKPQP